MFATIAVITVIAEKKKKFGDCSDHMETTFQSSQRQRSLRQKKFYHAIGVTAIATMLESGFLMITMITSLRSLYFFFSVITVIVAIIWKPGLSYASLLHKIRFNNYKQEGCIMLFTYSCFNCQNEKGLLNFVSERINIVYRINNTRYNFQKNKLPFKHLKPQFMGPILSN